MRWPVFALYFAVSLGAAVFMGVYLGWPLAILGGFASGYNACMALLLFSERDANKTALD